MRVRTVRHRGLKHPIENDDDRGIRGDLVNRVRRILTALQNSQTEINLVVAVDLPFLTKAFLRYLVSRIETSRSPLVACKMESYFPLCLGLRGTLVRELEQRVTGRELSVQSFIESSGPRLIILEPELRRAGFDASMFRNINTEGSDYVRSRDPIPYIRITAAPMPAATSA